MSQSPRVGIALAAYKPDIEFFITQLQSIVDQRYPNWFCIVGCDSSLGAIRAEPRLHKYFEDSRFEWIENAKQMGSAGNFEVTIQACLKKGCDLISCSDQDDAWHESKLSKMVERMGKLPPLSVLHCDMHILRRRDDESFDIEPYTAWSIEKRGVHNVTARDFMIRNVVAGAGMLMDAELARRYPNFSHELFYHDHWFPLVATYFGGVHALHEPLYDYRIHGNNVAGLSEYRGFFASSADSKKKGVVQKSLMAYRSTARRCEAAEAAKLPVRPFDKVLLKSRWDLGATYVLKALWHLLTDQALARACLVRAAGKVFSFAQAS